MADLEVRVADLEKDLLSLSKIVEQLVTSYDNEIEVLKEKIETLFSLNKTNVSI